MQHTGLPLIYKQHQENLSHQNAISGSEGHKSLPSYHEGSSIVSSSYLSIPSNHQANSDLFRISPPASECVTEDLDDMLQDNYSFSHPHEQNESLSSLFARNQTNTTNVTDYVDLSDGLFSELEPCFEEVEDGTDTQPLPETTYKRRRKCRPASRWSTLSSDDGCNEYIEGEGVYTEGIKRQNFQAFTRNALNSSFETIYDKRRHLLTQTSTVSDLFRDDDPLSSDPTRLIETFSKNQPVIGSNQSRVTFDVPPIKNDQHLGNAKLYRPQVSSKQSNSYSVAENVDRHDKRPGTVHLSRTSSITSSVYSMFSDDNSAIAMTEAQLYEHFAKESPRQPMIENSHRKTNLYTQNKKVDQVDSKFLYDTHNLKHDSDNESTSSTLSGGLNDFDWKSPTFDENRKCSVKTSEKTKVSHSVNPTSDTLPKLPNYDDVMKQRNMNSHEFTAKNKSDCPSVFCKSSDSTKRESYDVIRAHTTSNPNLHEKVLSAKIKTDSSITDQSTKRTTFESKERERLKLDDPSRLHLPTTSSVNNAGFPIYPGYDNLKRQSPAISKFTSDHWHDSNAQNGDRWPNSFSQPAARVDTSFLDDEEETSSNISELETAWDPISKTWIMVNQKSHLGNQFHHSYLETMMDQIESTSLPSSNQRSYSTTPVNVSEAITLDQPKNKPVIYYPSSICNGDSILKSELSKEINRIFKDDSSFRQQRENPPSKVKEMSSIEKLDTHDSSIQSEKNKTDLALYKSLFIDADNNQSKSTKFDDPYSCTSKFCSIDGSKSQMLNETKTATELSQHSFKPINEAEFHQVPHHTSVGKSIDTRVTGFEYYAVRTPDTSSNSIFDTTDKRGLTISSQHVDSKPKVSVPIPQVYKTESDGMKQQTFQDSSNSSISVHQPKRTKQSKQTSEDPNDSKITTKSGLYIDTFSSSSVSNFSPNNLEKCTATDLHKRDKALNTSHKVESKSILTTDLDDRKIPLELKSTEMQAFPETRTTGVTTTIDNFRMDSSSPHNVRTRDSLKNGIYSIKDDIIPYSEQSDAIKYLTSDEVLRKSDDRVQQERSHLDVTLVTAKVPKFSASENTTFQHARSSKLKQGDQVSQIPLDTCQYQDIDRQNRHSIVRSRNISSPHSPSTSDQMDLLKYHDTFPGQISSNSQQSYGKKSSDGRKLEFSPRSYNSTLSDNFGTLSTFRESTVSSKMDERDCFVDHSLHLKSLTNKNHVSSGNKVIFDGISNLSSSGDSSVTNRAFTDKPGIGNHQARLSREQRYVNDRIMLSNNYSDHYDKMSSPHPVSSNYSQFSDRKDQPNIRLQSSKPMPINKEKRALHVSSVEKIPSFRNDSQSVKKHQRVPDSYLHSSSNTTDISKQWQKWLQESRPVSVQKTSRDTYEYGTDIHQRRHSSHSLKSKPISEHFTGKSSPDLSGLVYKPDLCSLGSNEENFWRRRGRSASMHDSSVHLRSGENETSTKLKGQNKRSGMYDYTDNFQHNQSHDRRSFISEPGLMNNPRLSDTQRFQRSDQYQRSFKTDNRMNNPISMQHQFNGSPSISRQTLHGQNSHYPSFDQQHSHATKSPIVGSQRDNHVSQFRQQAVTDFGNNTYENIDSPSADDDDDSSIYSQIPDQHVRSKPTKQRYRGINNQHSNKKRSLTPVRRRKDSQRQGSDGVDTEERYQHKQHMTDTGIYAAKGMENVGIQSQPASPTGRAPCISMFSVTQTNRSSSTPTSPRIDPHVTNEVSQSRELWQSSHHTTAQFGRPPQRPPSHIDSKMESVDDSKHFSSSLHVTRSGGLVDSWRRGVDTALYTPPDSHTGFAYPIRDFMMTDGGSGGPNSLQMDAPVMHRIKSGRTGHSSSAASTCSYLTLDDADLDDENFWLRDASREDRRRFQRKAKSQNKGALTELETMYDSLNLDGDEDLMMRAEQRELEERRQSRTEPRSPCIFNPLTRSSANSPCGRSSQAGDSENGGDGVRGGTTRRSRYPHKRNDDLAERRIRQISHGLRPSSSYSSLYSRHLSGTRSLCATPLFNVSSNQPNSRRQSLIRSDVPQMRRARARSVDVRMETYQQRSRLESDSDQTPIASDTEVDSSQRLTPSRHQKDVYHQQTRSRNFH